MEIKLTFEALPVIAVIISVLAWYIPGFKGWYENLKAENKQLFMAGLIALTVIVVEVGSIFGFFAIYPVDMGWRGYVWYPLVDFVIALIANAGVYQATSYMLGPKK